MLVARHDPFVLTVQLTDGDIAMTQDLLAWLGDADRGHPVLYHFVNQLLGNVE